MEDKVAVAKQRGSDEGYAKGKEQDFTDRNMMSFALMCAGDYASAEYCRSYLAAFQQAISDLREEGVIVNDPREKEDADER